jgi:hypothetical protein
MSIVVRIHAGEPKALKSISYNDILAGCTNHRYNFGRESHHMGWFFPSAIMPVAPSIESAFLPRQGGSGWTAIARSGLLAECRPGSWFRGRLQELDASRTPAACGGTLPRRRTGPAVAGPTRSGPTATWSCHSDQRRDCDFSVLIRPQHFSPSTIRPDGSDHMREAP